MACYVVWVEVPRQHQLDVGALGRVRVDPGLYAYAGSARRGLEARVVRHLTRSAGPPQPMRAPVMAALGRRPPPRKRLRWHVDYLLEHPRARVVGVDLYRSGVECRLVRGLLARGAVAAAPRFGASDCRRRCPAHLLRVKDVSGLDAGLAPDLRFTAEGLWSAGGAG